MKCECEDITNRSLTKEQKTVCGAVIRIKGFLVSMLTCAFLSTPSDQPEFRILQRCEVIGITQEDMLVFVDINKEISAKQRCVCRQETEMS